MKWSKEHPSTPGWYWHRFHGMTAGSRKPKPIELVSFGEENGVPYCVGGSGGKMPFVDVEQWSGPLPLPEDGETR